MPAQCRFSPRRCRLCHRWCWHNACSVPRAGSVTGAGSVPARFLTVTVLALRLFGPRRCWPGHCWCLLRLCHHQCLLYSDNVRVNLAKFCYSGHSESFHLSKCSQGYYIFSKYCGSVHSENFLVSTYHLLILSLDINQFLLSKAIQACQAMQKCQQSTSAFRCSKIQVH